MFLRLLITSLVLTGSLAFATADTQDVARSLGGLSVGNADFDGVHFETLQPVADMAKLVKRQENLDLQDTMKLLWAGENASAVLDAEYLGDNEHVINMEDFADTVAATGCSTGQVLVDFTTQAAFDGAKSKWVWVNQQSGRHFFIIVKHAGCGTPLVRRPYNITNVGFDAGKRRAMLNGKEVTYESCVHDGRLVIDTAPPATAAVRARASVGKTVSLVKDFSGNIAKVGTAPNIASLDCVDCGTKGSLRVVLDASIRFFSVKEAFVEFRATDVSARINVAVSGQTTQSIETVKELSRVDIIGIDIAGIAKLAFGPAFGVGGNINLSGSGKVTFGAEASITPLSVARVCLKGCTSGSQGFNVTTVRKVPTLQGTLNSTLGIFPYATLSANAKLFSLTYDAGVALKLPHLIGSLNAEANSAGGVCNSPTAKLGLRTTVLGGIDCYAYLGKDFLKPNPRIGLFTRYAPVYSNCFVIA